MKSIPFLLLLPFAFTTLFADVAADAADVTVIKAGSEAPDPTLVTIDGTETSLSKLRGTDPTVVVFYRGGWCPYCNTHLASLQETMPQLKEKGWKLIALSPDKPEELLKTVEKQKLDYTLVSDSKMVAAEAFGVAFQLQEPMLKMLKSYKIDVVAASGEEHKQLPVPAVFLIDAEGKITFVYSNPDYKTRLSSQELLKAAE